MPSPGDAEAPSSTFQSPDRGPTLSATGSTMVGIGVVSSVPTTPPLGRVGQSSPRPSRMPWEIAATASFASVPCAVTTTFSPQATARLMIATMDLALAESSPRRNWMLERYCFARATSVAVGRA